MTQTSPALEFEDSFAPLPWAFPDNTVPEAWTAFSGTEALGDRSLTIPSLGSNLASVLESVALSSPWAYAHGMALVQWLQNYTSPSNAPLDQVQGWLEAVYHACEAELWPLAGAIAQAETQAGQPLYRQLGQWGHRREQVELCEALLPHITEPLRGELRQLAGDGQLRLGNYDTARHHYEALLQESQDSGNRHQALKASLGLVQILMHHCRYHAAIPKLATLRPEAEALGDAALIIEILQELAQAYGYTGKSRRSVALLQRALELVQTHGLSDLEVPTLRVLVAVYEWRGQSQQAMPHLHRLLAVAQAQKNLALEADVQTRLGRANFGRRRFAEAIAHSEQSLALYRQIHYVDSEIIVLNDLGAFHAYGLGQFSTALGCFQQAESLARQLRVINFLAVTTANQAYCYALLKQRTLARQTSQTALALANQDELPEEQKMVAYAVLGRVHWLEGRYVKALALVWQALCMAPPWRSVNGTLLLAKTLETLRQWPQQLWQAHFGVPETATD